MAYKIEPVDVFPVVAADQIKDKRKESTNINEEENDIDGYEEENAVLDDILTILPSYNEAKDSELSEMSEKEKDLEVGETSKSVVAVG
ncbi:hypothetical protein NDU88_002800 [Pleurodeles waltl]|uniref:Uncharacterized protein n=1 Tax=Pleurodeles waltl TaxID=8319 RepID=A0AAV7UWN7_PLEWA|nr:hypothetical protein NDU88_002800 [Pleurodeles waltl]